MDAAASGGADQIAAGARGRPILVGVQLDEIAHAVLEVGLGRAVSPGLAVALSELGLASGNYTSLELTPRGDQLYEAWHGYREREVGEGILRDAFQELGVTQALMQGLHGRKPVPVEGVLALLARHRLADSEDPTWFRAYLQNLNDLRIVAYSRKMQTVRVVASMPATDEGGKTAPRVRVIQPDRPYSNLRHLRETLRSCRERIWWVDAHFSRRGLEPLADEADAAHVKEIRILSGPAQVGADAIKDFKRFEAEMVGLGISAEWRVVERPDQEFHDRFIMTKGKAWNVPPINTLFKGDYSEISETTAPPFEAWWAKGKPIDS